MNINYIGGNWQCFVLLIIATIVAAVSGCGQSPDDSNHQGSGVTKDVSKSTESEGVHSTVIAENSSPPAPTVNEQQGKTTTPDWTSIPNPFLAPDIGGDHKKSASEVRPSQGGDKTTEIANQPIDIVKVKLAVLLLQLEARAKIHPLSVELQKEMDSLQRQFKGDAVASLNNAERLYAAKWWRLEVLDDLFSVGKLTQEQQLERRRLREDIFKVAVEQEAIKPHKRFELSGTVTDESGVALDDVTVTVKKTPLSSVEWEPRAEVSKQQVAGHFKFQIDNASGVGLRFFKPGYFMEQVFYPQNDPIHHGISIVLEKIGPPANVEKLNFKLQYSMPDQVSVLDIDTRDIEIWGASVVHKDTKRHLLVCVPQEEEGSIAVFHYVRGPLLKSLKVQVVGPDVGIIPFTPANTKPVERQMQEAPEKGYESKEIVITQDDLQRFVDMKGSGDGNACGVAFFYFKAGSKYGRCQLNDFQISKNEKVLYLWGKIEIQPNGSRYLGAY